jgi:hypothetical protein
MLEAARKVIRYTEGRQIEAFVADEMAYDATLRNLEILGEAAKNILRSIPVDAADVSPLLGVGLLYGHELNIEVIEDGSILIRPLEIS